MQVESPTTAGLMHSDSGDDGPMVVVLRGVLMNLTLWDTVVEGLRDRYRYIVPEMPFGAHTTPMHDDADLSLPALATLIAEFLTELDLHHVTLVGNDWGGAQLVISPGGADRVANLVLVSCEPSTTTRPGRPAGCCASTQRCPAAPSWSPSCWVRAGSAISPDLRRPVQAVGPRGPLQELDPSPAPQPQGPPRPTSATSRSATNCSTGPTSSTPSPARSSSPTHDTTDSCIPPTPNDSSTHSGDTVDMPISAGSTRAQLERLGDW